MGGREGVVVVERFVIDYAKKGSTPHTHTYTHIVMHLNRSGAIFLNIIDLTGVRGQEYTFELLSTIYPRGFKKEVQRRWFHKW